jgi:hypothetical protein
VGPLAQEAEGEDLGNASKVVTSGRHMKVFQTSSQRLGAARPRAGYAAPSPPRPARRPPSRGAGGGESRGFPQGMARPRR